MSRPLRFTLYILLTVVTLLLLLLVGVVWFVQSPQFKTFVSEQASEHSGRAIAINGDLNIDIGRVTNILIKDVSIGNADWSKEPRMASIGEIKAKWDVLPLLKGDIVLPELRIIKPDIALERRKDGKANWQFGENPAGAVAAESVTPEEPADLPAIGVLAVEDGQLRFSDGVKNVTIDATLNALSGSTSDKNGINLQGKGTYQGQPLKINVEGASILELQEMEKPYPFHASLVAGSTTANVKGQILTGDDQQFDMTLSIKGKDAADLYELTGIALPPTPPYDLTGRLRFSGDVYRFTNFKGKMGSSDLSGDLSWDTGPKPPMFTANFTSQLLDMADMKGFIGLDEEAKDDPNRAIPEQPLNIEKLKAMNADVKLQGKQIKAAYILDTFNMHLLLKNGVLTLKPLSFGVANGTINGLITLDGNKKPTHTTADITFQRLALNRLFEPLAKKFGEDNVSAGLLGGKAVLEGSGDSLQTMLGNANGSIGLGMEGGQLSNLLLEVAGLDIFKALGLLVTGDKPVPIHCVVGNFNVEKGQVQTKEFLIDTAVTRIRGEGNLNLGNENLDLRMHVSPKDASLLSARAPLLVQGTLMKPNVFPDPASLATRGGAAVALSVLLTPVGAMLAFLEPGLGEGSQCAGFVKELESPPEPETTTDASDPAAKPSPTKPADIAE